jgi:hypothetical protein
MSPLLLATGIISFFLFTFFQIYAAYLGFDYFLGSVFAILMIFLSLLLRFSLPITIAAFFGAIKVWHWHWFFATIFISPGLLFVIPGLFVITLGKSKFSAKFSPKQEQQEQKPNEVTIEAEYVDVTPKKSDK